MEKPKAATKTTSSWTLRTIPDTGYNERVFGSTAGFHKTGVWKRLEVQTPDEVLKEPKAGSGCGLRSGRFFILGQIAGQILPRALERGAGADVETFSI